MESVAYGFWLHKVSSSALEAEHHPVEHGWVRAVRRLSCR